MIDPALLNLLPPLRRARGDRLYGADQKHWVDLWKQDGAWLLGHRPEGAAKEWKNQLDKGLATWAPSPWPRRLETLVRSLVPGAGAVRVFRNVDRAPSAPVWRPWEDEGRPALVPGASVRLVLPAGPAQAVAVAWEASFAGDVPEHDVTSPAEAAALVHAVAQVLRFDVDPRFRSARLEAATAFDRHVAPSGLFVRRGLWFRLVEPRRHSAVFRVHLDAGFLLNPDADSPSLLPTALSPGEWTAWARAAEAAREVL